MSVGSYLTIAPAHDHNDPTVICPDSLERYWFSLELTAVLLELIRIGMASDPPQVVHRGLIPSRLVHQVLESVL